MSRVSPSVPLLDPKNDLVFKLLLSRRVELLPHMLSGILMRPILRATVLDPVVPSELPTDKDIAFDVRAELDDGSRADVEMQRRIPPELSARLVYYAARDYTDQLDRGDGYQFLNPTAVVAWLVEPLFPRLGIHSIFELRDRYTNARFNDHLAIHLVQLRALSSAPATGYAAIVRRWARFFLADPADLAALASEDPIMSIAKQTLEELSRDPTTRRILRAREDAKKLRRMEEFAAMHQARSRGLADGRAEGLVEGRAEGLAEGKADLVLKLLGIRFGALPSPVIARVRSASAEQLDTWAERVLTAATLDEVLAE